MFEHLFCEKLIWLENRRLWDSRMKTTEEMISSPKLMNIILTPGEQYYIFPLNKYKYSPAN